MGFSLLYGNTEAGSVQEELKGRMQLHYRKAAGLAALLIGAGLLAGLAAYWQTPVQPDDTACFSCMFDSLQNWWDRLSFREQAAIVLGAFALALLFVGFWPALGFALSAASFPGSGHEIAKNIRDPKRLLTPENAAAVLIGIALSRIPFGRFAKKGGERFKDWLEKLLRRRNKPDPNIPHKPDVDRPKEKPDTDKPDQSPPKDMDDFVHWTKMKHKNVELYDSHNSPLGEFDGIDLENGIFYEHKSAEGIDRIHPKTGKPQQTPQEFSDKALYYKTKVRINNLLEKAVGTRKTPDSTPEIPTLEQIKGIRNFQFQLDGDTPELRVAAENSLNRLRQEFPDYKFSIRFGVKKYVD
jgi:hypothetical protein